MVNFNSFLRKNRLTSKFNRSNLTQKQFLAKETKTVEFNRAKRIDRLSKLKVNIDGESKVLGVYKKKGKFGYFKRKGLFGYYKRKDKTIIIDPKTYKTLATTNRYNTKNVIKGFKETHDKRTYSGLTTWAKGKELEKPVKRDIELKKSERDIKLKNIYSKPINDFTDYVERDSIIRNKSGKISMSVTFIKGKKRKEVIGYSSEGLVYNESDRDKLTFQAWRVCVAQIDFSYDSYNVNWIRYGYHINVRRRKWRK